MDYGNMNLVCYEGGACFLPVCKKCGRFVKADKEIICNSDDGIKDAPNATCSKCGRIQMPFDGYYEDES